MERKRQLERANTLSTVQRQTSLNHHSSNAVLLGERWPAPPAGVDTDLNSTNLEEGASPPATVEFDVSKLDSSLHNKNKRRGFSRLSTSLASDDISIPQRIVFEAAQPQVQASHDANGTTPTHRQAQIRPRLVRPLERAERGELPDKIGRAHV